VETAEAKIGRIRLDDRRAPHVGPDRAVGTDDAFPVDHGGILNLRCGLEET
jgi:hypothetical protein